MFTSGHHFYLYLVFSLYFFSLFFSFWSKKKISKLSFSLFVIGFGLNFLYILGRGFVGTEIALTPIVEGPFFLPVCLGLLTLFHFIFYQDDNWRLLLILVFLFTLAALFYPKGIIPPTPKKTTFWAVAFFCSEIMAHACFLVGLVLASQVVFFKKNSNAFHSYLVWGFVSYSVSQIVGAIWSYYGWGNTFSWSPRHLSSASIWLLYAAYLHLPYLKEWNLKKRALFAIGASLFVIFISYGHYFHEMGFKRIGG